MHEPLQQLIVQHPGPMKIWGRNHKGGGGGFATGLFRCEKFRILNVCEISRSNFRPLCEINPLRKFLVRKIRGAKIPSPPVATPRACGCADMPLCRGRTEHCMSHCTGMPQHVANQMQAAPAARGRRSGGMPSQMLCPSFDRRTLMADVGVCTRHAGGPCIRR